MNLGLSVILSPNSAPLKTSLPACCPGTSHGQRADCSRPPALPRDPRNGDWWRPEALRPKGIHRHKTGRVRTGCRELRRRAVAEPVTDGKGQGISHLLPVDQVPGVHHRNPGKTGKGRGNQVIIRSHPDHAGIRIIPLQDRIQVFHMRSPSRGSLPCQRPELKNPVMPVHTPERLSEKCQNPPENALTKRDDM